MKAIVTGANGFIGTELIIKLIANKIPVLAVDITFKNSRLPESRLITKKELSLINVSDFVNSISFGEYELFYNFAWRGVNGSEKASYEVQLNNIILSLRCAEIAKSCGCKKYLCAGTIAERAIESLGDLVKVGNGMMYGAAKACNHIMLETYCKNLDLNFVWMQISNVYGPTNKTGNLISYTIDQLLRGETATFGPAKQPYDFIYIDDLVEAMYRLGINQNKYSSYFIGSGTPMILSEYLKIIGEIFGRPELVRIGVREDDGVKYSFEMMNTCNLIDDVGDYISGSFEEKIKYTIENY